MTNFERATRRLQSNHADAPRCLHRPAHDFHTEDSAREASRIDLIILAFAAGVALGMLTGV